MKDQGKSGVLRFLLMLMIFSVTPLWPSEEAVFFSIAEEKANDNLNQRLNWEQPQRQIIFLNGAWEIIGSTGQALGSVNVPCTFQIQQQLTFQKSLDISLNPANEYLLHLGEINGKVRLSLNDSLIYKNTRNGLPITLSLPITLLRDGGNLIKLQIKMENRRFGDTPAFFPVNLPRTDSGILSGIYLEIFPALFFNEVSADVTIADSLASISGNVSLNQFVPPGAGYTVNISYMSSQGQLLSRAFPVRREMTKSIALPEWPGTAVTPWSPATPLRYWIEATLDSAGQIVDQIRHPLVMRTVSADKDAISLNGEKIVINGMNYVYQNKEGSQLFDPDLVREDLEAIKKQGINAIRVIMSPLPEQFYVLCDDIGLICLQDLPLIYWHRNNPAGKISGRWQDYIEHLSAMSKKYNSVAAIGAAFYLNAEAASQRKLLQDAVKYLKDVDVLKYASTFFPEPGIANIVDFQIVEILQRNHLEANLRKVDEALADDLYFPSAYAKAMTYRIDSTTITHDLQQIQTFYEKLMQNALTTEVEGNFITTYNDFYLQLPSLQNGMEKDFAHNRVGLVDLKRQSRGMTLSGDGDSADAPAAFGVISESRASHSFLYIIIGFLNIFVFLITYRRYRIFRQNLGYSIQKPHGFFVSLSERIIIPNKQSFFLMLVISVNGAIIFSSIAYFYRNHLLFDYILSLLYYTPWYKSLAVKVIWDQALFLVVVSLKIILIFYLLALIIKVASIIGRRRVLFNQALAVSIWAGSPFIILLPLGILMYNLLLMMKSYWIIWGVLLYFHAWFYFRWINGIRVLTDRLYSRVFLSYTLVFLIIAAAFLYFYEDRYQVIGYLEFWYRLYSKG